MRLKCDFPVIGGRRGSLLGLSPVFTESGTVLQGFPCLQRGGKDHSPSTLEDLGSSRGVQDVEPLEQLGTGILWIGGTWA